MRELERVIKKYDKITFMCIGSDRVTGDCLGPLIGTFIKDLENKNIKVIGTLDDPCHALNIDKKREGILKDSFVIAIDACLGDKLEIGKTKFREKPINPGKGVGKLIEPIGDVSIIGIVNTPSGGFDAVREVRLNMIFNMSKEIAHSIRKAIIAKEVLSNAHLYNTRTICRKCEARRYYEIL